jgi:proton-dependent oligopeptide transporter, POT family
MQNAQPNHPASLSVFFATELWERYGFYVVQTLLALYLSLHFNWPDKQVYALVGSFTALAFLSPLVGGWIADHLVGQKRAILLGALVLFASYLGLSLTASDHYLSLFLAGITVGTGLLKPNISSLLGNEYPEGSPHRENGFMIFYMGLTTGIILGTTLPSYLNAHFGWPISFMSAAIGMVLATAIFSFGIKHYRLNDYNPYHFDLKKTLFAVVLLSLLWLASTYILHYPALAESVFGVVALFSAAYFVYCVKKESATQASQTMVLGLLCLISVLFWIFYFQMFLSLTLFIVRAVQPTLFGIDFPPPFYVGIESIGMIALGLVLIHRKAPLNKIAQGISIGNKFLSAMVLILMSYGLIVAVCFIGQPEALLSPLSILPAYLLISLAEMLLSPVGLSAVTLLASRKRVGTFMGVFLASIGLGAFLSGELAELTAIPAGQLSVMDLKMHYAHAFSQLLCILVASTLFCVGLNYMIKRLMKPAQIK